MSCWKMHKRNLKNKKVTKDAEKTQKILQQKPKQNKTQIRYASYNTWSKNDVGLFYQCRAQHGTSVTEVTTHKHTGTSLWRSQQRTQFESVTIQRLLVTLLFLSMFILLSLYMYLCGWLAGGIIKCKITNFYYNSFVTRISIICINHEHIISQTKFIEKI